MMDAIEWVIGWVLVIWLVICVITVPFVWAWMIHDERRYRRDRALRVAQDQAIAVVDAQQARDRHPVSSRARKVRGPEDDPRFMAWLNRKDK